LDAEFVQYKNLKGPDKNRARSVAISDSQFRILESVKVSHKKEDVFINAATIRINGITYESLIDGESLKEVKAKVKWAVWPYPIINELPNFYIYCKTMKLGSFDQMPWTDLR
jgi:hypothetical protein